MEDQVSIDRPPESSSGSKIQDCRHAEPFFSRANVSDIGYQCGIELFAGEATIENVELGVVYFWVRTAAPFAPRQGAYPIHPHEHRHSIFTARYTDLPQVKEDSRTTVRAVTLVTEVPNLFDEQFVKGNSSATGRSCCDDLRERDTSSPPGTHSDDLSRRCTSPGLFREARYMAVMSAGFICAPSTG